MIKHEIVFYDNFKIKIKREYYNELLVSRLEYNENGQLKLLWEWEEEDEVFQEFEFKYDEFGELVEALHDGEKQEFRLGYKEYILEILEKYKQ